MDNGKTLIVFALAFVLLAAVAVGIGQADPLTPAMSQASANLAAGPQMFMTFDAIFAMAWKIAVMALLLGVVWFIFAEGPKLYRKWGQRNESKWKGGPNAYWGKTQSKVPHLTRNDVMFWALANREGIRPEMLGNLAGSLPTTDDDDEVLL